MSSVPEYLGTTIIPSPADNFCRTWHVWASYDHISGELLAVFYGINFNLIQAIGELLSKRDCDTLIKKRIWDFAEEQLSEGLEFDQLIELELNNRTCDSTNVVAMAGYLHANKRK